MSENQFPFLRVNHLQVHFSTPKGPLEAVRDASFQLAKGETLGIVGESGSGKSVTSLGLLNLLPGNTIKLGGDVWFENDPVFSMTKDELRVFRGLKVGMIFQEPGRSFDPIYSIKKTMEETVRTHFPDMEQQEIEALCIARLKEVHIPEPEQRIHNYPHQFSGGLLQRVMIATSLLTDPDLLIADEPTTSLDVTIQAEIIKLLIELKEKRNLSIIFITHDLALIATIADRIAVMYAGYIMEEGPVQEILHRPRHPYTRALIDTIPNLGDNYKTRKIAAIKGTVPDPTSPLPGCPFAPRCRFVTQECKKQLPDLLDETTRYRCIIKGIKEKETSGENI